MRAADVSDDAGDDPVAAAYRAAGAPVVGVVPARARCARCGARGQALTPTKEVVPPFSVRSHPWSVVSQSWFAPDGRGLCSPCTFAYRSPPTRGGAHRVTRTPDASGALSPAELFEVLQRPVSSAAAVVVSYDERAVCLVDARWGHLVTPDGAAPWTGGDVDRLGAMARLRARGVTASELTQALPGTRALGRATMRRWTEVVLDWTVLDPWRAGSAHWPVAVFATDHVRP